MGIYYGEQSGKGFKAKLKVSEVELEKYLESWVLPNLVQFANLLHQRKPKFIKANNLQHLLKHLMVVCGLTCFCLLRYS